MSDFEHMFLYYTASMVFAIASQNASDRKHLFDATLCWLISVASLVTGVVWFTRLVFS